MVDNKQEAIKLLNRAKSNLNRGKECQDLEAREIFIEDLCFDLQQSAEKAFKALLLYNNITYTKTHDISNLISLLEINSISVPDSIKKAVRLNPYAVETRYTDDLIKITPEIYRESVELAESTYIWVKELIQ